MNLSHEIIDPSSNPCTVPDELCPRNQANALVRIHGLRYYKNFLSDEEQEKLLEAIYKNPWQKILARRQQFYGEVYYHTSYRSKFLQPVAASNHRGVGTSTEAKFEENDNSQNTEMPFSLDMNHLLPLLYSKCQPFFEPENGFPSQILINEYLNNLGIASHFEDKHAFGPIILTLSLVSPIYMTLKKPKYRTNQCHEYWHVEKILLEPGSLLVLQDDARWDYRHGISKYKWVFVEGQEPICRDHSYRRVSITMRHLLQSRRTVDLTAEEEDESDGWRYRDCGKKGDDE